MSVSARDALSKVFAYMPEVEIGEWSYGDLRVYQWEKKTKLKIGRYCSFATNVKVMLGGEHRTDWTTTYPFTERLNEWPAASGIQGHPAAKGDIKIGNDVWIGAEAGVLSGVTIGDGAVVGAYSIVSQDVPPYHIVAGSPARIIRPRFSDEQIVSLLDIAWWAWPEERVMRALPAMLSPDISKFIKAVYCGDL